MISQKKKVSIILPTYNRARFLPQALESIRAQEWTDWELIIVDDGSTDETAEIIGDLTAGIEQPIQFIQQENQGAYGARNTGLDHVTGKYVAFFDSDDEWLPHHLKDCVDALEENPDVDWVYGACRMIDDASGEVIAENTFYIDDRPRPFMMLKTREVGSLRIFSPSVLKHELLFRKAPYCGFQNSVLRAACFENARFETSFRNEAEDSMFLIRHILKGGSLAYIDNVHVLYNVHDGHSSAAGEGNYVHSAKVISASIDAYEDFGVKNKLGWRERIAFQRMLAKICFWHLGYSVQWANGKRTAALRTFERAIHHWPFSIAFYKTYIVSRLKQFSSRKSYDVQGDV